MTVYKRRSQSMKTFLKIILTKREPSTGDRCKVHLEIFARSLYNRKRYRIELKNAPTPYMLNLSSRSYLSELRDGLAFLARVQLQSNPAAYISLKQDQLSPSLKHGHNLEEFK